MFRGDIPVACVRIFVLSTGAVRCRAEGERPRPRAGTIKQQKNPFGAAAEIPDKSAELTVESKRPDEGVDGLEQERQRPCIEDI